MNASEHNANDELARHLRVVRRESLDDAGKRRVERIEDLDPGVNQGRNKHHNPQRDRDIAALVAMVLLSCAAAFAAGVALFEFGKWVLR